jgi:pyruvate dehydrogenase E1 component beta subunit
VIYVIENNGAYKITEGLWKKYGDKRLVDTPISEAGFIGMGIGAAMLGLRPVIEIMFWSFAYVAYDQIINNAGCVRYMSGGLVKCTNCDTRPGQWRNECRRANCRDITGKDL